jgi:lysozyme
LRRFQTAVNDAVNIPLSQNQFDALVSLAYNIGTNAFKTSTLVKYLNALDYKAAADQFLVWNKAGGSVLKGLVRRREAERALFLKK